MMENEWTEEELQLAEVAEKEAAERKQELRALHDAGKSGTFESQEAAKASRDADENLEKVRRENDQAAAKRRADSEK